MSKLGDAVWQQAQEIKALNKRIAELEVERFALESVMGQTVEELERERDRLRLVLDHTHKRGIQLSDEVGNLRAQLAAQGVPAEVVGAIDELCDIVEECSGEWGRPYSQLRAELQTGKARAWLATVERVAGEEEP